MIFKYKLTAVLTLKKFDSKLDKKEKYYGVEYSVNKFSQKSQDKFKNKEKIAKLHIQRINTYLLIFQY